MNDITSILTDIKGYGGYSTTIVMLGLWWKGLPKVLDAWANRQSKTEERMGKLLEDAQSRFAAQIKEADERHKECVEAQDLLRAQIVKVEDDCKRRLAEATDTIDRMRRQMTQIGISTYREATGNDKLSPPVEAMIDTLSLMPVETGSMPEGMEDALGRLGKVTVERNDAKS